MPPSCRAFRRRSQGRGENVQAGEGFKLELVGVGADDSLARRGRFRRRWPHVCRGISGVQPARQSEVQGTRRHQAARRHRRRRRLRQGHDVRGQHRFAGRAGVLGRRRLRRRGAEHLLSQGHRRRRQGGCTQDRLHRLRPRQGRRGDAQFVPLGTRQSLPCVNQRRRRQRQTRRRRRTRKSFNVRGQGFLFDPRTLKFETDRRQRAARHDHGRLGPQVHVRQHEPGAYADVRWPLSAEKPVCGRAAADAQYPRRQSSELTSSASARTSRGASCARACVCKGSCRAPTETGEVSGHFTGTTGVTVYRGDALPPEYRGTLFVGEVSNNLVYHVEARTEGPDRNHAVLEKDAEFLASTDNWFRPAQFANAPDGTLYVIDTIAR